MEELKIRSRADIPVEDTWALEDLYASDALWDQELESLKEDQEKLVAYAGKLGNDGQTLYDFLVLVEATNVKLGNLGNYCMRKGDQDTRDYAAQAMLGRYSNASTAIGAAASFETPEIMAIEDEKLEQFYADFPKLERFRRYLTDSRRLKEHTLSAAEERLMAAASEMAGAPSSIFNAFNNADMVYPDALDSEGKAHPVTKGSFILLQTQPDRVLRKNAYESVYTTVGNYKNTAAAMLNAQGKQLKFYADARKFPSALDASLARTNVPTSVYHNLIDTVHENLPAMHRYIALRKKLLGLDEMHFYDVHMPLMADLNKKIPFAQAKETVYEALAPMGEEYRAILKEGFDNRWIDVYENPGKRGGAYSAGARVHPYVLLNYNGSLNSQFTLSHEMGHAVHSYLSHKKQNPIDSSYVIFVAEVASTCNESLVMEHLLSQTTDKKERAYLINHFLEKFRGIIYRQTMFAEFERFMGSVVDKGGTLTADMLCAEYKRLNEEYYGPALVVDDFIATEWARIPHFYYNYYVFQYATGFSAAIALSRQILNEGKPAVDRYLNFLSGGKSKSPIDLLKGAGVDMTTPAPVNDALAMFAKLVDELEELMED